MTTTSQTGMFGQFGGSFIPPQLQDVMKNASDN